MIEGKRVKVTGWAKMFNLEGVINDALKELTGPQQFTSTITLHTDDDAEFWFALIQYHTFTDDPEDKS